MKLTGKITLGLISLTISTASFGQVNRLSNTLISDNNQAIRSSQFFKTQNIVSSSNLSREKINYLVPDEGSNILEEYQDGGQYVIRLIDSKGNEKWEKRSVLSGFGGYARISNNGDRIVTYGYDEANFYVTGIYDSLGNTLNEGIWNNLIVSPSTSYFVPKSNSELIIYDENLQLIPVQQLNQLLGINTEGYLYLIIAEFVKNDILKISLREFEVDDSKPSKKGKAIRIAEYLIDIQKNEIIFNSQENNSLSGKIIQEIRYENGFLMYSYLQSNETNTRRRSEIQVEVLDFSRNTVTKISEGPYVNFGYSKEGELFYVSKVTQEGNTTLTLSSEKDFTQQVIQLENFSRIESIIPSASGYIIKKRGSGSWKLRQVEEITQDGITIVEYNGWFNNKLIGVVPIEQDKIYLKNE
jgi:hypothetical protein